MAEARALAGEGGVSALSAKNSPGEATLIAGANGSASSWRAAGSVYLAAATVSSAAKPAEPSTRLSGWLGDGGAVSPAGEG